MNGVTIISSEDPRCLQKLAYETVKNNYPQKYELHLSTTRNLNGTCSVFIIWK